MLWIPQNLKESWRDRREHSAARDHPTERPGGGGTYLLGDCHAAQWDWSPDAPVRPRNTGNPKAASTDGSVITSHTCDSWYRTWMQVVPAKDHAEGT